MGVAQKRGEHKTREGSGGCGWVGASSGGGDGEGHMGGCHVLEASSHGAGVSRVDRIGWCVRWGEMPFEEGEWLKRVEWEHVVGCGKWGTWFR